MEGLWFQALQSAAALFFILSLSAALSFICMRQWAARVRSRDGALSIGFLHPWPLAGGGGERVLWCAVKATASSFPEASLLIYGSLGGLPRTEINTLVGSQFGLDLSDTAFEVVDIGRNNAGLVSPTRYPQLTLIRQAIGAALLGLRAYWMRPCGSVVETGNFAFALVAPRLLGARTMSYVHYPTISADMLAAVRGRAAAFNNASRIAGSPLLSAVKLLYYRAFALLYAAAARAVDVAAANSSWTRAHLRAVWGREEIALVFPPCPTISRIEDSNRDPDLVISLGQFRPEKGHAMQLSAFEALAVRRPDHDLRLVIVGGARNAEDRARAAALKKVAHERNLPVEVRVNVSRKELASLLPRASIGLHTMRNEHFGISVVELQAAGLLVVAHRSGGVAQDIIDDGRTGFLARDGAEDYAECLWKARCALYTSQGERIRNDCVKAVARFSDSSFQEQFVRELKTICGR